MMSQCSDFIEEDVEEDVRDELDIADMLYWFGHTALGLSLQEAREIDKYYNYPDWRTI